MEVFSNFGQSTLATTINNSQTTLMVASATNFPTSGTFRVLVESEIMKVTAVSGTTFTIVRGQEGTSAASHNSNVFVTAIITSAALAGFRADDVTLDLIANRPAAGAAGRLFIPSDNTGYISFDDGSNWNSLGIHSYTLTPSTTGTFGTALGNGSPTFSQSGDVITLDLVGSNARTIAEQLKTVTPAVTITSQLSVQYLPTGSGIVFGGLAIRDSSTGNTRLFGWHQTGTTRQFGVLSITYISGTPGADPATVTVTAYTNFPDIPRFLRIVQPTSGNRTYQISNDSQNWAVYLSEAFNTGAASVNQAGFALYSNATYGSITNNEITSVIRSYKET